MRTAYLIVQLEVIKRLEVITMGSKQTARNGDEALELVMDGGSETGLDLREESEIEENSTFPFPQPASSEESDGENEGTTISANPGRSCMCMCPWITLASLIGRLPDIKPANTPQVDTPRSLAHAL